MTPATHPNAHPQALKSIVEAASPSPTNPPVTPRNPVLDGVRGLAVLLVVAMHYVAVVPGPPNSAGYEFLARAFSLGFSGVDLFFVLSGFFISGILFDHAESPRLIPAFYARRFFRIVPLYGVLLATFWIGREISSLAAINRGTYFTSTVPEWTYLAFVQNLAMSATRDIGPYWLGATWSLAVEEQFYLLFPFFALRLTRRQLAWLCAALICIVPVLRGTALLYAHNNLAAVFLLPTRADGLLWGVLCAIAVRNRPFAAWLKHRRRALALGLQLGAIGMLGATVLHLAPDLREMAVVGYSLLGVFYAVLVLLAATSNEHSRMWKTFGWRPLAWVGLTSYFTYLFHTPVWYVLHWLCYGKPPLHSTWGADVVTMLALPVTLVLAWLSWKTFEGPLLRFARRFSYA